MIKKIITWLGVGSLFGLMGAGCSHQQVKLDLGENPKWEAPGGPGGIYVPIAPAEQRGQSVLMLVDNKFNDMETFYPYYRLVEAGFQVTLASPKGGSIQGGNGHVLHDTQAIAKVDVKNYDGLYIPGGKAPASLREDPNIIQAVRDFHELGRPIGAICHGPQVLVTANVVSGRNMTSVAEVGPEITEAGGHYSNQSVVVDGPFVTSRLPMDIPLNLKAFLQALEN